jgi:hypothetical protein
VAQKWLTCSFLPYTNLAATARGFGPALGHMSLVQARDLPAAGAAVELY